MNFELLHSLAYCFRYFLYKITGDHPRLSPFLCRKVSGSAVEIHAQTGRLRRCISLRQKAARLPLARGRRVRLAIWAKRVPGRLPPGVACFTPGDVLRALR